MTTHQDTSGTERSACMFGGMDVNWMTWCLMRGRRYAGGRELASHLYWTLVLLLMDPARGGEALRLLPVYWNTSNPIFRVDNTDHVRDAAIGDSVDFVCPHYPVGTPPHLVEYLAIYRVTEEEYLSCSVSWRDHETTKLLINCDKPYSHHSYRLVFRDFTPLPQGLEFRRATDYYFASTSTGAPGGLPNNDMGVCASHNVRLVVKVCCAASTGGHRPETRPLTRPLTRPHTPGRSAATAASFAAAPEPESTPGGQAGFSKLLASSGSSSAAPEPARPRTVLTFGAFLLGLFLGRRASADA